MSTTNCPYSADRAKKIRVHAQVNESSTDKVLRQLREENDKLKKALERGVIEIRDDNKSLSEKGKFSFPPPIINYSFLDC